MTRQVATARVAVPFQNTSGVPCDSPIAAPRRKQTRKSITVKRRDQSTTTINFARRSIAREIGTASRSFRVPSANSRPKATNRTPRAVNRGIRERVALRSSIQTALVRSRMVLSSIHSNQAEEILLQVFFLNHHLCGRNPGLNQQAGNVVRVFK